MAEPILVAGEWRQGRGAITPSHFPADGSVTAEVSTASIEDTQEAIEKAHAAWPAWAALLPHQRASVLYKVSDLITADVERLAQLQTRDNGKPLGETRALVMSAAGTCRYFAAACETLEEELTPSRGSYMTLSIHEAMGVVGAITPWNSPIASEMQKIAPALAAGNAVVVKPADATPLLALELGKLFEQAGLPKGLLSILPGRGSVVGDAIVRHPLVKKVSFTGGTVTGRKLAHIAAEKLMPISLELGGKSPTIVFDDCDLEHALQGVLYGIFSSAGQACIAGARLFVQATLYDQFVSELVKRTEQLRVGHPEDPTTQVGPLVSASHRESVDSYVQVGLAEGGKLLTGGKAPEGEQYAAGSYYLPTIISGLNNQARICQEEIFGPVLVVLPFKDEADLLAQANDSVFGLASGLWTRDYQKAWRIARALQAGTVWINTYKTFSVSAPFGGFKDSGLGREKGRHGIRAYQQQKSVYWGLNETPNPWAY
ncbi:MAG: aldehyde dehydrogenase [Thiothrix sp.]|nr:MAG: aldehyde dehydrogenase [Thiothrix sp.]